MTAAAVERLAAGPGFIAVGAEACGLDWWLQCLAGRARVRSVATTGVFDGLWTGAFTEEDAERYRAFFPVVQGEIAGEVSPDHMYHHWIPRLLRAAAPEARILVMLRDPIARYRAGIVATGIDYKRAADTAAARGLYHHQLTRLLKVFDRGRVMVLQLERCLQDPAAQLDRSLRFLGVDADSAAPASPPFSGEPGDGAEGSPPPAIQRSLIGYYGADLRRLLRDWPDDIDADLWPTCRSLGAR